MGTQPTPHKFCLQTIELNLVLYNPTYQVEWGTTMGQWGATPTHWQLTPNGTENDHSSSSTPNKYLGTPFG